MLVGDLIRRKSSLAKRAWITLFERRNIEQAAAVHLTSEIEASELRALGFRSRAFGSCCPMASSCRADMPNDDLEQTSNGSIAPMCYFWVV